jgi:hypothetical protein
MCCAVLRGVNCACCVWLQRSDASQHSSATCLPCEAPVHQAQLVDQRPTPQAACGSLNWVHGLLEAADTSVCDPVCEPERAQFLLWLHWLQSTLAHRTSLCVARSGAGGQQRGLVGPRDICLISCKLVSAVLVISRAHGLRSAGAWPHLSFSNCQQARSPRQAAPA